MATRERRETVSRDRATESYPLAALQSAMLVNHLRAPHTGVDIVQMVSVLPEAVDVEAMRGAWEDVSDRHAALRTAFLWDGVQEPLQQVYAVARPRVDTLDWTATTSPDAQLRAFMAEDRIRGFDLSRPPLQRVTLMRIGDADWRMVWTFHHILLDGRAFTMVLREVFAAYEARMSGRTAEVAPRAPFRDFVTWYGGQDFSRTEKFWRERLAGITKPTSLPGSLATEGVAASYVAPPGRGLQELMLSAASTGALESFARANGLTMNNVVQGAWALLLARYAQVPDVIFGATRACRKGTIPGADDVVGLFINTVPVRVRIRPELRLAEWLTELREQWRALFEAEHTPLRMIQRWSGAGANVALFDTQLVFENIRLDAALQADGGAMAKRGFHLYGGTNFPVTMLVFGGRELSIEIEYAYASVSDAAAARVLRDFAALLDDIAANPDARVAEFWREPPEVFWKRRLAGFTAPTPLGIDRRPAPGAMPAYTTHDRALSAAERAAIGSLEGEQRLDAATLVAAAWAVVLGRYSREEDVVFGYAAGDATVPLRTIVAGDTEMATLAGAIRAEVENAEQHPLAFSAIETLSDVAPGSPLVHSVVAGASSRTCDVPLAIELGDEHAVLRARYDAARVDADVADRALGHVMNVLMAMRANPRVQIKDIDLLSPAEAADTLARSGMRVIAVDTAIHQRFEEQVVRAPERIALVAGDEQVSYGALNDRANRVANALMHTGVGPDVLVGLYVDRSSALVIGALGILKAGGAYLPLDPRYPASRLAFMVEDSKVPVIVTTTELAPSLPPHRARVLCVDDPALASVSAVPVSNPDVAVKPEHLAYVIYTSGSTGNPKGVMVTHANVVRLMDATYPWYNFDGNDVWTLFHSFAFDFSVWEMWGALLYGGRLVLVPYEVSRNPADFLALMQRERVTVLNQTPSAFKQLAPLAIDSPAGLPALRYVVFGGEALDLAALKPWFERFGDQRPSLINMYGITETTVHVTYRPVTMADVEAGTGSVIGVPIPDLKIFLVDQYGRLAPTGVPGEILVGGSGLARGYLKRPELTAERFVPDRFEPSPGARLYRTGDLARRHGNGELEYMGRIDLQVKIRGFRIELGEIEAALAQHPAVAEVVVIVREDRPGDKRLVAYVVGRGLKRPSHAELRAHAGQRLPEHMVPAAFMLLDALPLTGNGKVDRKALPALPEGGQASDEYVAPRSANETTLAKIWSDVLRVARVGIHDNFYELGGDSILSIQIAARARDAGLPITVGTIAKHATIAEIAHAIGDSVADVRTEEEAAQGASPLTPIQRWFFALDPADRNHWNQAFLFGARRDLDVPVLRDAVADVIAHHDVLHSRFVRDGDGWRQEFGATVPSGAMWTEDLSHAADADVAAAIASIGERAARSLDIETGECMRAVYIELGATRGARVLLVVHHLVVDGVSWRVLVEDLEAAYERRAAGSAPSLPARTTSYQRWARALEEDAKTDAIEGEAAYWASVVSTPSVRLPVDRSRSAANTVGMSGEVVASLNADETAELLQRVSPVYATQINDVLLTALSDALAPWAGRGELLVSLEGHGREDIGHGFDLSRTIGWFTSIYPFRLPLGLEGGEGQRLKAMKEALRAVPRRGIGYGSLRYLSHDAALEAAAPAEFVFNYLGQFDAIVAGSSLLEFAKESAGPWISPRAARPYLLEVNALVLDGRLEMRWAYGREIHDEATVRRVATAMVESLRGLIAHCRAPGAGGRTPSDYPLVALTQEQVDALAGTGREVETIGQLSPMQALFLATSAGSSDVGFEQWRFAIEGTLDPAAFRSAWEFAVRRHEILRTSFHTAGLAAPVQVVHRHAVLPFVQHDLRDLDPVARAARVSELLAADRSRGFRVDEAPLMRIMLIRMAETEWLLVWSNHHLLLDRWSWPIVLQDVGAAYVAFARGAEPEMAPATPWRRYLGALADRDASATEAYWRSALSDLTATAVPRLEGAGEPNGEARVDLTPEETARVVGFARATRVTVNTVISACWALWLARTTGQSDTVLGVAVAGRPDGVAGIDRLVGMCINNVPARVRIEEGELIAALLARVAESQRNAETYANASLTDIQEWSGLPWHRRVFDTLLVFQHSGADEESTRWLGDNVRVRPMPVETQTNYPLAVVVGGGDALNIRLSYHGRWLGAATAAQVLATMRNVLLSLPDRPQVRVGEVLAGVDAGRAAASAANAAEWRAPRTDTEWVIAHTWAELLGLESIGIDDSFFDRGGQSLVATQIMSRVRDTFRMELPVSLLFEHPTVAAFAAELTRRARTAGEVERIAAIVRRVESMSAQELAEARANG